MVHETSSAPKHATSRHQVIKEKLFLLAIVRHCPEKDRRKASANDEYEVTRCTFVSGPTVSPEQKQSAYNRQIHLLSRTSSQVTI